MSAPPSSVATTGSLTLDPQGRVLIPPGVGTHVRVMQAVWILCLTLFLVANKRVKLNLWPTKVAMFMWSGVIVHHLTIAYMKVFPPTVYNYGCAAAFVSAYLVISEPGGAVIEGYQAHIVYKDSSKPIKYAIYTWISLLILVIVMSNICLVVMFVIYSTGYNPTPNPWQDASNYLTFVSLYMRSFLGCTVAFKLFLQTRSLKGSALTSLVKRIYGVSLTQAALALILSIGIAPPASSDTWYSSLWVYPVLIVTDFIYAHSALQGFEEGKGGSSATDSATGQKVGRKASSAVTASQNDRVIATAIA